ncbi:tRNA (adenosine(37)-N6)-threonylcarbamoyltransferase complex ATPase subunit type 1 TsaE [Allofrancisella guangzhouensis]|uniref:tRNA threonylcarbamoyladenosine biosynthesis protein TsaE n=1 Tax=Allofrancisella guangzhouensis TaxID=594679 RepID=A0A0A8E335_9GAMM|nr:tRNA (adenosine(37)-N6)-threonylcarbamoyltransferase complex ATPase subunit type 1 TsaE [Allofrancisella guangzhouensis]AJC48595.1 ADP-binding protein [Allofrancisella guangzhouensis]MBK2027738.1 tRNA (adenosine(37)-N6)-threonylcarbamoyltransferase complex ATPase subunit type 1 TsaE [Allofrancisella guangzhouensis]MBK2043476.1 tRNA (adenosine(37)-N6)-threonylcarbamoyltransferase complex ATPase subunit type 1 TsaE [Allofrancisella guangzhouensis]MBK2045821.1 tRNA (adenosine(37)-N6)-threonylca
MKKIVSNEEQMLSLAAEYSKNLQTNKIIFLHGDLGSGKTTFVKGVLKALGYKGNVKSPTYTLVESYEFKDFSIYHFDLYRISDPEELEWIGIRDYFNEKSICFIEWPDKGKDFLPKASSNIYIKHLAEKREVEIS